MLEAESKIQTQEMNPFAATPNPGKIQQIKALIHYFPGVVDILVVENQARDLSSIQALTTATRRCNAILFQNNASEIVAHINNFIHPQLKSSITPVAQGEGVKKAICASLTQLLNQDQVITYFEFINDRLRVKFSNKAYGYNLFLALRHAEFASITYHENCWQTEQLKVSFHAAIVIADRNEWRRLVIDVCHLPVVCYSELLRIAVNEFPSPPVHHSVTDTEAVGLQLLQKFTTANQVTVFFTQQNKLAPTLLRAIEYKMLQIELLAKVDETLFDGDLGRELFNYFQAINIAELLTCHRPQLEIRYDQTFVKEAQGIIASQKSELASFFSANLGLKRLKILGMQLFLTNRVTPQEIAATFPAILDEGSRTKRLLETAQAAAKIATATPPFHS